MRHLWKAAPRSQNAADLYLALRIELFFNLIPTGHWGI
jgi:hypothetical protein